MQMSRRKNTSNDYTEPTLHNYDGDLSKRWFINFYIKDERTGEFVRKRITSINSGDTYRERMEEARKVLKELKNLLKEGVMLESKTSTETFDIDLRKKTFIEALDFAVEKKKAIIDKKTHRDYISFSRKIKEFLKDRGLTTIPFRKVNTALLYDFFDFLKEEKGLSNKTYNNYHIFLSAVYNLFIDRKVLTDNPCKSIKKLRVEKGGSHKPFTNDQIRDLKEEMIASGDNQLWLFVSFIYYCFIRPHKELRLLQIQHLHEKTIFIPPNLSKNSTGAHITIPLPLEKMIQSHNLRSYPGDYYIFSSNGIPGLKPLGRDNFYNRHKKILTTLGLQGKGYDIYGYKHTGNIALVQAGANIKQIQMHNRHSSLEMTSTYLQNLGTVINNDVFDKFPEF